MNHIYRVVWNAASGCWAAVAESARGHGKDKASKKRSRLAAAAVLAAALSAAQAQVPSAVLAPGGQATIYVSPNGTTVVNINAANAAGLSHNRYQQFNVNANGLVLNNTTSAQQINYQSQLAGQLLANFNIVAPANVILNEVVSNNRSTLAGFTEVLGNKADVVLANPYGITCSGCGFINTDRVTLSTGVPFLAANGALGGFNVNQGNILVTGSGLNATAQQVLDLVTRSVRLEAAVNAKDLGIFAGPNRWDYGTRAITGSADALGSAPAYAIDSSALGGMYANRIRLMATEAGVGVRMLGDAAASAEDFTLSAAGRIELRNRLSAQRDVLVASSSTDAAAIALVDATLTAARDARLSAAQGGLALERASLIAGNDLEASAARIDAGQGSRLQAAGALEARATAGELALGAAAVRAGGDLHLAAAGLLSTAAGDGQGVQSLGGQLAIEAGQGIANAGTITADQGNVTLRASGLITNSGQVNAGRNLDIADAAGGATQAVDNRGSLLAGQSMATHAAAIDNSGWMQAGNANTIEAASLRNSGKVIATSGSATLHLADTLANTGSVRAAQDVIVAGREGAAAVQRLDNGGDLLAGRAMDLNAAALSNQGGGWIQAATGSAVRAGTLDNAGTWLLSQQAGASDRMDIAGTLLNSGVVQSAGELAVTAGALDNRRAIAAAGNLGADVSGGIRNAGGAVLQAGGTLSLASGGAFGNAAGGTLIGANVALSSAQGLDNAGVVDATSGGAAVRVDGAIANSGTIHATSSLGIADRSGGAAEAFGNSGKLLSDGSLSLAADSVRNESAGWIQAAGGSRVDAGAFDNAGTWLLSTQGGAAPSQVNVAGLLANRGTLQALGDASFSASRIDNQAGALLRTGGRLQANVSAADGLGNAGTMQAGSTLGVSGTGSTLANAGLMLGDRLAISVGEISNAGTIQGGSAADSSIAATGSVDNQAGATLTLATASSGGGTLSGQRIANAGMLQSLGALTLGVGNGGLTSQADGTAGHGDIVANGALTLQALGANSYTATVGGTLQSGGLLRVAGDANSTLALNGNALGDSIDVDIGNVSVGARAAMVAQYTLDLDAAALSLAVEGSGADARTGRILAAVDTGRQGRGTVRVSNAFTNDGLLFSAHDLEVQAPSITVGATGAISALNDLEVHANGGTLDLSAATPNAQAGNLNNAGLLYAGRMLTAQANGTLVNTGDIHSDDSLSLRANTLLNSRIIDAGNDIAIVAATLKNEVPGLERITTRGPDSAHTAIASRDDVHKGTADGGNKDEATLYQYSYTTTQSYSEPPPEVAPQITAGRHMQLAFHEGRNIGGTIYAGASMNLQGFSYDAAQANGALHTGLGIVDDAGHGFQLGGAKFTNDNLALTTTTHVVRYSRTTKYIALGPEIDYRDRLCDRNGTWDAVCYTSGYEDSPQSSSANNVLRAGLYTASLRGSGFSLVNNGSTAQDVGSNQNLDGVREAAAPASTNTPRTVGQGALPGSAVGRGPSIAADAVGAAAFTGSTGTRPLPAMSFLDANAANGVRGTSFGGINIALPANPNGYFVTAQSPGARYLVESNPLYLAGTASVGSDYLTRLLGYDADKLSMRLGDASYEAWLVKQQIIKQTGSAVLASYQGADTQMKGLMESAATQSGSLGLVYGKALTPEQQASLRQDIVWMVQTEIGGKTVLAPVVYLAQGTRNKIASGAVISAQDADLSVTSLTNTGGTIVGGRSLVIASAGDITNLSGLIKGGNVSLSSTQGSIVNKTASEGGGGEHFYNTVLGKTAGIESTGTLALDAKKDIANLGATLNAGTDASLKAGGNVTFDTIEKKETSSTFSNIQVKHGSGTKDSTTTSITQVKSGLTVGGNLAAQAGNDITLAGTDAKVGGNADLQAGNNLNIIARENTTTTHTETKASGFGMNSSLYGTTKTTEDSLSVRNVGSSLEVGGNASLAAKNDITVQGSNVDVKGDGRISATNVNVLAGRNYDETHTTTTNTGVMQVGASGKGSASAAAASKAGSGRGLANASAEASAGAAGKGAAGLAFSSTTTTTTDTTDLRHVGSNLSFGGNLAVDASKDLTLQGSTVNAGGNAAVNAQNVNLLAAEDKKTSSTSTTTTKIGLMASTDNKAQSGVGAAASAAGGKGNPNAGADAQAGASATSENHLDVFQQTKSTTRTLDTTHQGSAINAKGNLDVTARDGLTLEGSTMSAGRDMTLAATDMSFKAVDDVHQVSTTSSSTTAGLYASGKAQAGASAEAGVGIGAKAGAQANASATGEVGLYGSNTSASSVEGSTTAVTSGLSAGNNITRKAANSITDVGTRIEGGGNLDQSAKTITSLAAADTTYASSESTSHTAKLGVYGEASASVSAEGQVGPGASKQSMNVGVGGGVKASYEYGKEAAQSNSSTAVVSTIRMGGSVSSSSSGKTTLEGTQIAAAKDVTLEAGSLDYKAAQNTGSSSSSSTSAGGSVKADIVNKGGSAEVSYQGEKSRESTSTAVAGGIASGGNLTIKTQGDTRLEGTHIAAGGAATVDAGGKLDFEAAKNTASSSSEQVGVAAGVTATKKGGSGSVDVSVGKSRSSLDQDVAGSISSGSGPLTLRSGGDASFTGTAIASTAGDVTVAAGGNLAMNAARTIASSESLSVDVSAAGGGGNKEKVIATGNTFVGSTPADKGTAVNHRSGAASLGVGSSKSDSNTATGGGITSGGGKISLSSGGNTSLEGTQVAAANGVAVDTGGSFETKAAVSTSSSQVVGFSASTSGSTMTPSSKTGAKTNPPAGAPAPAPAPAPAITAPPAPAPGTGKPPATPPPATPGSGKPPAVSPPPTPGSSGKPPAVPPPPTPAPKPPASPFEQQKGGGMANVYVDTQKNTTVQNTTISGGAGGIVVNQGKSTPGAQQISASVPLPAAMPPGKAPKALTSDGKPLPAWLKFDPKTGTFQGKPPAGIKGELKVNVSVPQADGTTKTVPMRFSGQ